VKILITPMTLILTGVCLLAPQTPAAGYSVLHSFSGRQGLEPEAPLVQGADGTLYGTTSFGGKAGEGTVFRINTDGTGCANLHSFSGISSSSYPSTNSGGAQPVAGLILSGNTLYGTAYSGGSGGYGTVFSVNTDGTSFMTLYSFANGNDGAWPSAGLILSGNTLYGTAYAGGSGDYGTVFSIDTDGAGFTNLHSFAAGDGGLPKARLILSGGTLYGTTMEGFDEFGGGSAAWGTVFSDRVYFHQWQ